jgi:hypothetical protein
MTPVSVDAGGSCSRAAGPSGCAANSTEYTCTGSVTPVQGNPLLTCGPGIVGTGGASLYCCASIDAGSNGAIDAGSTGAVDGGGTGAVDAGGTGNADAGACTVGATTGSAACDQCLSTQCCNALVACDTPDSAGVNDAGASACEQLLSCILDCVAGNADAGVAPGTLSQCQMICDPIYTSTEQQSANAVLSCETSSCASMCQ